MKLLNALRYLKTRAFLSISSVDIKVGDTTSTDNLMGTIIAWMLKLVQYIGIGILVWGVIEIVLSFTQDMPDKKIKGITLAFSGAVCIGLKAVLGTLGIIQT